MTGHAVRLLVAILTFALGVAVVRALRVIPYLEHAVVNRIFQKDDDRGIPQVPYVTTDDTNEIYRLVIQRNFKYFDPNVQLLVLASEPVSCPLYEDDSVRAKFGISKSFHDSLKDFMPEVESQTLDDYLANSKSPRKLSVSGLNIRLVLVTADDLPKGDVYNFWTEFHKRYPRSSGIISLSNIGFNQQRDQAFLYASRHCGGLCAQGDYVLLKKVDGRWRIVKEDNVWVS